MELPPDHEVKERLETVLTTIYLLFNEGYYSASQNSILRKDFCVEAMRLNFFLTQHSLTNQPIVNALLSLMCFHASRFEARVDSEGALVLYDEQDRNLWDTELILRGEFYLNEASKGNEITKYHLEAAIAYWHTIQEDNEEKWENILQYYNQLLQIEYSPIAALNRTYALSKARDQQTAIKAAEKLGLDKNHLYHSLLGNLYTEVDSTKALAHLTKALSLARTNSDKMMLSNAIDKLRKE